MVALFWRACGLHDTCTTLQYTCTLYHCTWSQVQGNLADKRAPPARTLQRAYAQGSMVVRGGSHFPMHHEVPLYRLTLAEVVERSAVTTSVTRRLSIGPANSSVQGYLSDQTAPPPRNLQLPRGCMLFDEQGTPVRHAHSAPLTLPTPHNTLPPLILVLHEKRIRSLQGYLAHKRVAPP